MAFDLERWREEHGGAWRVTLDGREYIARPVSARAVADLAPRLLTATAREQFAIMRRLFRLAFPWRPSFGWRGDPVAKLLALEPAAYRAVCDDFFGHLGLRAATARSMSGTDSPN